MSVLTQTPTVVPRGLRKRAALVCKETNKAGNRLSVFPQKYDLEKTNRVMSLTLLLVIEHPLCDGIEMSPLKILYSSSDFDSNLSHEVAFILRMISFFFVLSGKQWGGTAAA